MSFRDFADEAEGVRMLQRSLERGRLAHAYLFIGDRLETLEGLAGTLAKTLNCKMPVRSGAEKARSPDAGRRSKVSAEQPGPALDCCDRCASCQKIERGNHADVFWVRPESKLRQIKIEQIARREKSPPRVMLDFINLKPTESSYKIGIVVAADRMNDSAANAFLKTLEEPPPGSVLILLTTEPQRVLETIRSRCLRLNFGAGATPKFDPGQIEWLQSFSAMAGTGQRSLMGRYGLLDLLTRKLNELRATIEGNLKQRSPLEQHEHAEAELRDQWEEELKAAIEAEYRRQRADVLRLVQWWLRDVWVRSLQLDEGGRPDSKSEIRNPKSETVTDGSGQPDGGLLRFPALAATAQVAQRITARDAAENLGLMEELQRRLHTNVQEALALEVSLLKLKL